VNKRPLNLAVNQTRRFTARSWLASAARRLAKALARPTMEKAAIVATFLFFATPAIAAPESYVCTVQSLSRLADDGTLLRSTGDPIEGRDFGVDRASGKIIGKYLGSGGFDTKVLDAGSDARSF
jgi:hypothetical protein